MKIISFKEFLNIIKDPLTMDSQTDSLKLYYKNYYSNNKEKYAESCKKYYEANKDMIINKRRIKKGLEALPETEEPRTRGRPRKYPKQEGPLPAKRPYKRRVKIVETVDPSEDAENDEGIWNP